MGEADELYVSPEQAAEVIDQLVDNLCGMAVDFSDSPLLPEELDTAKIATLTEGVALAGTGAFLSALDLLNRQDDVGFEFEYLRGKILFAAGKYCDASDCFARAALLFDGYGELWFLLGIVNHQLGLRSDAGMFWKLALKCNDQHQDARLLFGLFEQVMEKTERRINPESYLMQPLVEGKGIDVGCGSAKTDPAAIGVDLIAPGAVGEEASQKGKVSQADIQASGDHLPMFPNGDLDYVIARHNLEHYPDPHAALMEWARILKPGGVIGLVLPDDDAFDTLAADPTHTTPFTRSLLKEMVEAIDGLELVVEGDAIFAWSFYAIIQKRASGGEWRPYPYWERLNTLLAADVSQRIKRGEDKGNRTLVREANRKKDELLGTSGGATIRAAFIRHGENASSLPPLAPFGLDVYPLPLSQSGAIDWLGEKILREKGISLVITSGFSPACVRSLAFLALPVICRIGALQEGETRVASDIDYSRCHIVTTSEWLRDRFIAAGAPHVVAIPEGADDAYCEAISFPGDGPLVRPLVESEEAFFQLRTHMVARLADVEAGVADKNILLRLWRRVGDALASREEEPVREIFATDGEILGWNGLALETLLVALRREWRATEQREVSERLAATTAIAETGAEMSGLMRQAAALLMFQPPFVGGSIDQSFFNAMAAGVPVFAPASEALGALYRPGEEILCFRTVEEACALWENTSSEKRREIGAAARRATRERHSQAIRWREILAWAGYERS